MASQTDEFKAALAKVSPSQDLAKTLILPCIPVSATQPSLASGNGSLANPKPQQQHLTLVTVGGGRKSGVEDEAHEP